MTHKTPKMLATAMWILMTTFILAGCQNESSVTGPETNSNAPKLPDVSTMRIDIGFLGELPTVDASSMATGKPSGELAQTAGERSNWINGVVRALFLQLTVYDTLEEPVGAFAVAVNSVPQAQDDGSYLWTYIFKEDSIEYSIFLYGTPRVDRVEWRLEVSSNNPELLLDHFIWFDGESFNDDSQGHWQFYEPVDPAQATTEKKTIRIDWFNETAENRLRISVNQIGGEDEGDWLEFRETATLGAIDYFDASESLTSNITAFADNSGSIQVPDYNDGLRACWDTEQFNTECP